MVVISEKDESGRILDKVQGASSPSPSTSATSAPTGYWKCGY